MRPERALAITARLVVGAIFLYAGLVKLRDPVAFAGSISAYRILPYFANFVLAAVLPWLEIICGALLVAGMRFRGATAVLLLLNFVFIGALVSALVRGLDIDCGCFRQGGGATSPWVALGRDILLMGALLLVFRSAPKPDR